MAEGNNRERKQLMQVCVPITAFPVAGGMRSVLAGVQQAMEQHWQMIYLTNHKGPLADKFTIEVFGGRLARPWQFPQVVFYVIAGGWQLFRLLRKREISLILPQDGVFSAAFAVLLGKPLGIRVVCMDHGNMTWFTNPAFRQERLRITQSRSWLLRLFAGIRFACYHAFLYVCARISTMLADGFLVAGDEVEAAYREVFNISSNRIVRYAYIVDPDRFRSPDGQTWRQRRLSREISEHAIVITMINRLAVEKGLDYAIKGIARAMDTLPDDIRARVKVLIAGDGPLRVQVEAAIQHHQLEQVCVLLGEATPLDVVELLSISDIFLYSGTRGTNYSMAVLEAMAASCAVVASTLPLSNARLLAEERGIAIPPGDAQEISNALIRLCTDAEARHNMGQRARAYIQAYHTEEALRRTMLSVSSFVPGLQDLDVRTSDIVSRAFKIK